MLPSCAAALCAAAAATRVQVERDVYKPRLLQVKGKRVARISEVPLAATR
jgi:hypothetical protein